MEDWRDGGQRRGAKGGAWLLNSSGMNNVWQDAAGRVGKRDYWARIDRSMPKATLETSQKMPMLFN